MRRSKLTEFPNSRLALWSSRLSWFALTVAALSVAIVRSGIFEVEPALATFAAALVCAVLAVFLALASFIVIWRRGFKGLGHALNGMALGLALLAYPAYLGYFGSRLPLINDITTDPDHPPQFNELAHLRPRGTNDYPGTQAAALQKSAYPDIAPLQLDVRPRVAYNIVIRVITGRKWHVLDSHPPDPFGARQNGLIEAVARTPVMGLRHDVVVRVGASGTGARVDVRSASRFGISDFGANAKRVRELIEAIDDAAGEVPDTVPEPEKRPAIKRIRSNR